MNYYLINLVIQTVAAFVCSACAIAACIVYFKGRKQFKHSRNDEAAYLAGLLRRRAILSKRIEELEHAQAEYHKRNPVTNETAP